MFTIGLLCGLFLGLLTGFIIWGVPERRRQMEYQRMEFPDYSPSEFVGGAEGIPLDWRTPEIEPKK